MLSVADSVGLGLLATLALVVVRYAWIGPLVYALGRREERNEKRTYRALLALYYFRSHPSKRRGRHGSATGSSATTGGGEPISSGSGKSRSTGAAGSSSAGRACAGS